MAAEVLMPALSPTMEEGTLAKWLVKEGDRVSAGDPIAEIETDKATMEVEAVDDGVIAKILTPEGTENVQVNAPIAVIAAEGEEVGAAKAEAATPASQKKDAGLELGEKRPPKAEAQTPASPPSKGVAADLHAPAAHVAEPEYADAPTVEIAVRDALRDAMAEEMRRDPDVFVMGEEVAEYQGAYKVTRGLLAEFGPKRVVDTPITEYGFAHVGVGAAFNGLKPIVEFMTMNFALQAIDAIVNSAAKTRYMAGGGIGCPIVFRGPNAAAARVAAQHSQDFAPWYMHVPGLIVIAPYDAADAKGLLKAAIRDPNPVVFLEHELLYGETFQIPQADDFVLPIGRAKVMREGDGVTIVSYARGVKFALEAADRLRSEKGIEAEVINLRTLRPIDFDTVIESVKKTNRAVTVEESWRRAGVGAELAAEIQERAFDHLDAPVLRVTQEDVPLPYAANLEALSLPNAEKVFQAALKVAYAD